ncbi:hypothetical protein C8R43DRAFT_942413 [Mycena crocata]|nr:hypothetical protein C8R43DRAFT_942413 [Mycena crocata]
MLPPGNAKEGRKVDCPGLIETPEGNEDAKPKESGSVRMRQSELIGYVPEQQRSDRPFYFVPLLDEDVVHVILTWCDVATILTLRRINRTFYEVGGSNCGDLSLRYWRRDLEEGRTASGSTNSDLAPASSFDIFSQMDMTSGETAQLTEIDLPDMFLDKVVLFDDIVLLTGPLDLPMASGTIVFNWRLNTYVNLETKPCLQAKEITLVPDRVVVCCSCYGLSPSHAEVFVYYLKHFKWRSVDHNGWMSFSYPRHDWQAYDYAVVAPPVTHTGCQFHLFKVFAYPCPVHAGDYTVQIYAISDHMLSFGEAFRYLVWRRWKSGSVAPLPHCGKVLTFRLTPGAVEFMGARMMITGHSVPTPTGYSLGRTKTKNTVFDVVSGRAVRWVTEENGVKGRYNLSRAGVVGGMVDDSGDVTVVYYK